MQALCFSITTNALHQFYIIDYSIHFQAWKLLGNLCCQNWLLTNWLFIKKCMYTYVKYAALKRILGMPEKKLFLITANEKFNFLMQIRKGFCKNNAYQEKIKHYVMNALKCNPPSLNIFLLPHPRGLPNQFILALYNHWMTPNQLSSP